LHYCTSIKTANNFDKAGVNGLDISEFRFRRDFDRDYHITLCATSIQGIRTCLGATLWKNLHLPVKERDVKHKEARMLVKHLIRVASESADFYRTVDFITRSAAMTVEKLRQANKLQSRSGHLKPSADLTHEHMVPGEAVLRILTTADPDVPLAEILAPLTYRALVCKKQDIGNLDKYMKSTLPSLEQIRQAGKSDRLASLPPKFNALVRYDVAGLFEDLIAVSTRATQLRRAYLELQ
jgi:hypothetical protein